MLYSKILGKTNKDAKEFDSINATLLQKAGFIDQTMSGVYTFLPLGWRVLNKIEDIIRKEMDKVGSEMFMPSIVPTKLWEQTGRFDTVDVLFKVEGANERSRKLNDATYVLNATHEDVITPIAKKFNFSYKDLPLSVYQVQTKFRNEARPKSGILRGREFRMKDLYSFHKSLDGFKKFYEAIKENYSNIYKELGLENLTYITLASGGDFTKEYSHEFQTKCESGEDLIFHVKSSGVSYNKEIAPSKSPIKPTAEKEKKMEVVNTPNVTGVDELVKFMGIPKTQTIKTIIYEADDKAVAVGVRGDYDVNEIKLKGVLECKNLVMASEETIKKVTGAEVGYAGLAGLPEDVVIIVDDSLEGGTNLECGANKTDHHNLNVNFGEDIPTPEKFYDIKEAKEGDLFPETEEKYETIRTSEVGNIFPLMTKFSDAIKYTYTDGKGEQQQVFMGSYGIGSSRLMGVLVEVFHDDKGIVWPKNVAPFQIHLIGLNLEDKDVKKKAFEIYELLQKEGIETLFDDREHVSAGQKFNDSDLIGCPYRVVVSKKTGGKVELKQRDEKDANLIEVKKLLKILNK